MKDLFEVELNAGFTSNLPADPVTDNYPRQVQKACFSWVETKKPSSPHLLHFATGLLEEMNLTIKNHEEFLCVMSGEQQFQNFRPYSMCYGGHQFGHWAGQLGDGRAINVAEFSQDDRRVQLQLKGAGPTPYSRSADGFAVLRSSVREYLCSEAMHYLGVPTTRALSLATTGDDVMRDMLYNGNVKDEQGAVVCRVAPSFIRFGNFQLLAQRGEKEVLQQLTDYCISSYFPHLGKPSKKVYLDFFQEVCDSTIEMVVHWQRVGFVHGVMNTDNMSTHGLTIDYGPYGWLEDYDPSWTPNTTDAQHRRYRFGNQPNVALWNLAQLGNALYPLIEEVEPLQAILDDAGKGFAAKEHAMYCDKLGLMDNNAVSTAFVGQMKSLLEQSSLDYTIFFRSMSGEQMNNTEAILNAVRQASYLPIHEVEQSLVGEWQTWIEQYFLLIEKQNIDDGERSKQMKSVNPKYVLRNYMAQLAIDEAEKGNYDLIDELYQLLLRPYDEQPKSEKWYAQRPDWAMNKVGCSMLSCSS